MVVFPSVVEEEETKLLSLRWNGASRSFRYELVVVVEAVGMAVVPWEVEDAASATVRDMLAIDERNQINLIMVLVLVVAR